MIRWLRRHQPRNVGLAILYWIAIAAATVVILAVVFFQLDRLLPASF